jgi:hypothetical protein
MLALTATPRPKMMVEMTGSAQILRLMLMLPLLKNEEPAPGRTGAGMLWLAVYGALKITLTEASTALFSM